MVLKERFNQFPVPNTTATTTKRRQDKTQSVHRVYSRKNGTKWEEEWKDRTGRKQGYQTHWESVKITQIVDDFGKLTAISVIAMTEP